VIVELVRHGWTQLNEEHRYCGWSDPPLSTRGRAELEVIRQRNLWPTVERCWHSDLTRTTETAALLFPNVPAVPMDWLREMNFGAFEGRRYDELKHEPAYLNWITNIETASCPQGESKLQFETRVALGWQTFLDQAAAQKITHAAVVSHGGVIVSWMARFFPEERDYFARQPELGCGYRLTVERGRAISYRMIRPG
jgi:alpha-ribazole phosphatase